MLDCLIAGIFHSLFSFLFVYFDILDYSVVILVMHNSHNMCSNVALCMHSMPMMSANTSKQVLVSKY